MKLKAIVIIVFLTQLVFGQTREERKWHVIKQKKESDFGYIITEIDTIIGDTAKYFTKSNRYIETNRKGITIVDGHQLGGMGTKCGCEPMSNGYWIERYDNGNLKAQGKYDCSRKSGTWIYYHGNGQVKKIENYKKPYIDIFTNEKIGLDTLKNNYLLEGPYLEYYQNGTLKTDGKYEIVEEYSETDTLYTVDVETYELIKEVTVGNFWIPKSKKHGIWNEYSKEGKLISHQFYKLDKDKTRNIESRYWDLIKKLIKAIEELKE
jgi:antitoxin component YwqK of YwqJK toxin-antitoxin module